jgi:glucosamine--fructose-6-phosphate aminotransferase (isomerizing)
LYAVQRFRDRGAGPVLAITCYPDSPLAQRADLALVAPAAQEQSVAQTRSFTSMVLLAQALAAVLADDQEMLERLHRLPSALTALTERVGDLPRRLGADLDINSIYFLGGGPLYGIACEAMLKTKEMSLSWAEAYFALEFRHGPMSMVNERTLVVGLLSDDGLEQEIQVLADMQHWGARVLALVDDVSLLGDWQPDTFVELGSGLDQWERQPLYLPVLQRLAYHRAVAKGLNPDRPTHLEAVVEL